jgi:hypothetical protein
MDRPIRTSLPTCQSIRLCRWTYNILARDHPATDTQNGRTNQNITTSTPHIRQNGWAYIVLARNHCHPYTKMDGPIRQSLPPCHPQAKMDGLISFLYAATLPPIRQNGPTNKSITTSMPQHTPKCMDLHHSCTRPPCHP